MTRRRDVDGPIIRTERLTREFLEQLAIDEITLTVEPGTIVGLIGPSGCGKSTLVRMMLGIVAPTDGTVEVFGRPAGELPARERNRLGYMPQLPVLFPNLSVASNLGFVASLYGVPWRGRRRRVNELLELVDLEEHRHKQLADCSGGMQRRLSLAATLVHGPTLLFLDEPTAGVDPILRERFWERFRELRNAGTTIVVPTQYVGEAVSCDQVAVLSEGRLIELASPDELRDRAFDGVPLRVQTSNGWVSTNDLERIAAADFVESARRLDDDVMVVVDEASDADRLEHYLGDVGLDPVVIEPVDASFDQIFVELIQRDRERRAEAAA